LCQSIAADTFSSLLGINFAKAQPSAEAADSSFPISSLSKEAPRWIRRLKIPALLIVGQVEDRSQLTTNVA
jgi:hypothetical protein